MQHLDRDVSIVLEVVREVHGGHTARAEFTVETVAVGEGRSKSVEYTAHRGAALAISVSEKSAPL